MKIAVSATGKDLEAEVDPRFGRARHIVIVDSQTLSFEIIDNSQNLNALKGAGIQTASAVAGSGAEVLLTGHCGPNAFKVLKAAGILVANNAMGTVREAVASYLAGKLPVADEPDVEGQW
ncbi:MAG: dinitrogenase iron-molybdenum cofactor biosynthesis protein [Desulfobacteraceae bacterium]|jgi:predicted Fe-Mo cluster-binding NifX family protein|nr:MAG: dinitrogenase iron-molybdenum cofactor biosynthesis protein [Desulfobacteraceae bacterium]